ncbi:MAG: transferrin-binding protein-like solute binding protein [Hyphomicrobiales bacterium]
MKKIILSATALSGLLLTGCIPLDSDKVGVNFDFAKESTAALANVTAEKLTSVNGAQEGNSYKSSFDPTQTKYSAQKSTILGLDGFDIKSKVTAIANGTTRIKNGNKWDRVQNHPLTVDMDIQVNLASIENVDDALVTKANFVIQGEFGTDDVTAFRDFESHPNNELSGKKPDDAYFIPTGGTIKAVISDVSLKDYAKNLLTPKEKITDKELYGAYRNGDQYTAFFAAGTAATEASQVKENAANSKYDINYRGIANWGGTAYDKLGGTGNLNVNFKAGTYKGDITVKNGAVDLGEIAFDGSSTNTVSFNDNQATYTPTGQTAVKGYVEGSAYGNDAATFMGVTDFANGNDVLVGAFNATAK